MYKNLEQTVRDVVKETDGLVKKKEIKNWETFVRANARDFYSETILRTSINVMKALSEGKTPRSAYKLLYGISRAMASLAVDVVYNYYQHGEEFRKYWNRKNGYSGNGVVNPSIIEL